MIPVSFDQILILPFRENYLGNAQESIKSVSLPFFQINRKRGNRSKE